MASLPGGTGEVGLLEFDLGYVAWPVPPPSTDPSRPPVVIGAPRAVIDKETGELSVWPSLAAPAIAERYRRFRAVRERFPGDVREVLTAAGWRPDRDVSVWVGQWLDELYETDRGSRERLPILPAARAALDQFGGLKLVQQRRVGYAGGGFRIEFWPGVGRVVVDTYADFAAELGMPVFPLGWYEDGSSDLVITEDGRVFLLHPVDEFLVGDTVEEAVIQLVRGPDLRPRE
jgi:hypothetical protein